MHRTWLQPTFWVSFLQLIGIFTYLTVLDLTILRNPLHNFPALQSNPGTQLVQNITSMFYLPYPGALVL